MRRLEYSYQSGSEVKYIESLDILGVWDNSIGNYVEDATAHLPSKSRIKPPQAPALLPKRTVSESSPRMTVVLEPRRLLGAGFKRVRHGAFGDC